MSRIVSIAAGFFIIYMIGIVLIKGGGIIIPLVIAILIWNLLNTIINSMHNIPIGSRLPYSARLVISLFLLMGLVIIIMNIISQNVNEVIQVAPRYQENIFRIVDHLDDIFHINTLNTFNGFFKNLNLQQIVMNIYGVFTSLMGSALIISLYVIFLFVEQHYFEQKFRALAGKKSRHFVESLISQIGKDTQVYLGIKTLLSLSTAVPSWLIMKLVGLDFAEFWALLIFFLNYIPNIGAIIATVFPSLLALIQFTTIFPFLIVSLGIVFIQFIIGNFVEPRFLSRSLNLSPLVIIISLAFWGSIWGVIGMFLAVPITVMLMIVFTHFDVTRPVAILLSQNGEVKQLT
jgi:AI-2 transport protein TqsA